jgi:hypothetical protein
MEQEVTSEGEEHKDKECKEDEKEPDPKPKHKPKHKPKRKPKRKPFQHPLQREVEHPGLKFLCAMYIKAVASRVFPKQTPEPAVSMAEASTVCRAALCREVQQ